MGRRTELVVRAPHRPDYSPVPPSPPGLPAQANSIEGSKQSSVKVVYTPWSNLHKRGDMDVGQIGFHNTKLCRYINVDKKSNEVVNRLNKTKKEKDSSTIRASQEEYERGQRAIAKKVKKVRLSDRVSVFLCCDTRWVGKSIAIAHVFGWNVCFLLFLQDAAEKEQAQKADAKRRQEEESYSDIFKSVRRTFKLTVNARPR